MEKILITAEEMAALLKMRRSHKIEKRISLRAEIILLAYEGHSTSSIARSLHVSRTTVIYWKKRFQKKRIAGLYDLPRPGRPRVY